MGWVKKKTAQLIKRPLRCIILWAIDIEHARIVMIDPEVAKKALADLKSSQSQGVE